MEGKDKSNTKGAKATDNGELRQVGEKKNELAKKMYNIKNRKRPEPMSEKMKRHRGAYNAITPSK